MASQDRYIAPKDLAWAFDRCKLCYWDKLHRTGAVNAPFATVLNVTAAATERALTVENMRRLGIEVAEELPIRNVRSKAIGGWGIQGQLDKAFVTHDSRIVVVDAKLSSLRDSLKVYQAQLAAYAYALEHPDGGAKLHVSRMGLVVFVPNEVLPIRWNEDNHSALIGSMKWVEFPWNEDAARVIAMRVEQVKALYDAPAPPPSTSCDVCNAVDRRVQRALALERATV